MTRTNIPGEPEILPPVQYDRSSDPLIMLAIEHERSRIIAAMDKFSWLPFDAYTVAIIRKIVLDQI
jgi:hypothetical protein